MFSLEYIVWLAVILLTLSIQISLGGVLGNAVLVPDLSVLLVLSWIFTWGFSFSLPWILLLGFIGDILLFHPLGLSMAFLVFMGYSISFFSRRFLVEHRIWGAGIIVLFIALSTLSSAMWLWLYDMWSDHSQGMEPRVLFQWKSIGWQIVWNEVLFVPILLCIRRIDAFLLLYKRRIKPKNYIS